jgi:hypothetical protein
MLQREKQVVKVIIGIFVVGCLGLWLADDSYPPIHQTTFVLGMVVVWFVGASILGWPEKNDAAVTTRSTGRSGSSVNVTSWNSEGKTIRIPVNYGCYNRLLPGKSITVIEKDGAFGMHWIAGIAECSR